MQSPQCIAYTTLTPPAATDLLDADVVLRNIQDALSHSSTKTTEIYTHLSDAKGYKQIPLAKAYGYPG